MKKIWYDPAGENSTLFRDGLACWVSPSPDASIDEVFGELPISVNSYWGLLDLGVVDRLAELPTQFLLGPYEEGVLLPEALGDAARILREVAAGLDGGTKDMNVASQFHPEAAEFWICIDLSTLRRGLLELADFVEAGARNGHAVQLWL